MVTPKPSMSIKLGARVMMKGLLLTAKQSPLVFAWINLFSFWFVGGGVIMLVMGSTSILPVLCVLTPLLSFPWIMAVASKYGYSRLVGLPRFVPWLPATGIALMELISDSYVNEPSGYQVFLYGFLALNFVCTLIDIIDVYRWYKGERQELVNTGFFQ